jgi:pyruvate formate lyase activating enzyme
MDIKSSLDKYPETCGNKLDVEKIKESIALLTNSPVEYEFKLTLVPSLVDKQDIAKIGEQVKGAKKITLQQFRPFKVLDKSYLNKVPYGKDEIEQIAKELQSYVTEVNLDFID